MKLIADENLHSPIINSLRNNGFTVDSIKELFSGMQDEVIIKKFSDEGVAVLTQDKDVGDLIFKYRVRANCIILLKVDPVEINLMINILLDFFKEYTFEKLKHKFIVLTPVKKRFRDMPEN